MSTESELPARVAVVGSGYWGRNLVRNFSDLGALAGLCDTDPGALAAMREQYQVGLVTDSYDALLESDAIDSVAIATPAAMHGEMVRKALLAGKDVFVEKPLCLSESQAKDLTACARELDRILMVGHLLWYHPGILKLRELIAEGELGRVRYIYSNRLNMGKLRREENVLWSFAPHDVSVVLGLLGEEPSRVSANGGNFLHEEIADTTVTLLEFASGVRAHIFVSWLHPFKEQKLVVVGDRQMAVFDDTLPWPEKLTLYPHKVAWEGNVPIARKADAAPVALSEQEPLHAECSHFLECVRTRERPRTDGNEGLRVLAVLNAGQRALETGNPQQLSGATGQGRQQASDDFFVHDTAVVDDNVAIGSKTRIWHFSHILGNSRIGAGCSIGQNVMVGPDVQIGDNCKIQNNVSVYNGVTLEDGVFCGPSCVFTNVINPRAEIEKKSEFLQTTVRRGATIGANATIVCGVEIGAYAFIGAGAVVTRNVPTHALVLGNPARRVGWMSKHGERLSENLRCPASGICYRETEFGLEEIK